MSTSPPLLLEDALLDAAGSPSASHDLTASEVVDRARAARAVRQRAEVVEVDMVLAWARLHPCPSGEHPADWGEVDLHGESVRALAGEGAPLVAEFAPYELAAALGISLDAGRQLVADSLELAHRLPRLWELTRRGVVPVWQARLIARETTDLGPDAVAYADRLITAVPGRIGTVRAAALADEARLYFDPDRAVEDERHALARRGVWVQPGRTPATNDVTMTLDTTDALAFDRTVSDVAAGLRALGDTSSHDVRRARAVGVLADPQAALDLLGVRSATADPDRTVVPASGSDVPVGPGRRRSADLTLFVHLTPHDLPGRDDDVAGAVVVERFGAATNRLLDAWITRHTAGGGRVVLRPVLDLTRPTSGNLAPVDVHDPTPAIRDAVLLRDPTCVFPGCTRDSRTCDLDHVDPYEPLDEGGPPGQTGLHNLAPLCRTHHRLKTHHDWVYRREPDGSHTWTSPTGHVLFTPARTRRPPARPAPPTTPAASTTTRAGSADR